MIDGIPASSVPENAPLKERATASFLRYLERKLSITAVRHPESELAEAFALAGSLRRGGVIKEYGRTKDMPDEPYLHSWYAVCNNTTSHVAAGATWESDSAALTATLAEGLERYIWHTQEDYFVDPLRAEIGAMGKIAPIIEPERFAGFTDQQRMRDPQREFFTDATYLWLKGFSLVSNSEVYIPAQMVSGCSYKGRSGEPLIRSATTNGLASWPTKEGARLRGALELIERDAYMIMWLNQLTAPQIALDPLCAQNVSLKKSVETCTKYRLKTHAILMKTDAPTYAVAVVMEDESGHAPRFTVGLRASSSLADAIQKAMTEALRSRRTARSTQRSATSDRNIPVDQIGHLYRLFYWSDQERAKQLEFLIKGPEQEVPAATWESDSEEEHLQRIADWCARRGYEFASVSLGASAKNPTPLHIEMTVIPELQPLHLTESTRAFGGMRLREIPEQFGYRALAEPFVGAPHPFV